MKRKYSILSIIIFSLLLASCSPKEPVKGVESSVNEEGDIKTIKVTDNNVSIKEGCGVQTNTIKSCEQNETYDVINKVDDWYAVKLPDNNIGFVPTNQCKAIVKEPVKTVAPAPTPNSKITKPNTIKPYDQAGIVPSVDTSDGNAPSMDTPEINKPKDPYTNVPKPATDTATNKGTKDTINSGSLTAQEQEMLNLVNQARKQNGLSELKMDMELANVARIKSQDMIDNNYFSHNSPTHGSPFDMMKAYNINYVKAAENIAGNQTVAAAHDGLMKSPGHRKNLLNPEYTHIGIGIQKGGQYGNMFTQMFVSKPR